ncbi:NUDIX hydrolase [Brevibacillus reuszeri]|uniref:ADP-ribose pyrophosphatase n=1 Tax=Brevibacillus reuszeri TaxID=54915 RepID=A0A0K9Z0N4_9BACL|nr:NUDIX domain-containing protein [Brevibacillus reuszeri]KNB74548.1 ADP-ribose pyrophosphatase [Brevibacillus reuszeri]MED1856481.1 NUDIX domain-containing protein [Brevibacillus reuszeri]GED67821.1 NUDIX hydrolase [Brevibacillus reuszeri]
MRWFHSLTRWYWKIRRPLTLGTRVIVTDEQKGVLLIRHTYTVGWYLPGGGVEKGETFFEAARRELREECGITAQVLSLCHLFYSEREGKRDHIALFHAPLTGAQEPKRDPVEVAEMRFFPWDKLPGDLSPATRRRLHEFREQVFQEERW